MDRESVSTYSTRLSGRINSKPNHCTCVMMMMMQTHVVMMMEAKVRSSSLSLSLYLILLRSAVKIVFRLFFFERNALRGDRRSKGNVSLEIS